MIKEKLIQLTASILGIHSVDGRRTAVMIPKGATVEVTSGPLADSRMVDVLWEGRSLALFAEDLFQRGKYVKSRSA